MAKTQIAPNLFILEKANGKKYYVARLTVNGKQVDRGLGNADKISLREAKYELARLIANPNPEPKKKTESTGMTFAEAVPLAMADIANVKRYKNDRSVNQWLQSLNDYAIPHLGHIDVEDITREDVLNTLKPIWFKIPETAKRTRARIESVLAWAIRRGHRKTPNCATWKNNLDFDLPAKEKIAPVKHHEAPTYEEIKKIVRYCLEHPSPVSGAIIFDIATAVRISEVRLATPEEIDGNTWICPVDRRKVGVNYRVPLSTLAMKALEMAQNENFIFTAQDSKPISIDSPRQKIRAITGRGITMHGCRSTFKDWCLENEKDDILSEKSLMHTVGDKSYQAYQRADLLERRRKLMQEWADFLMS